MKLDSGAKPSGVWALTNPAATQNTHPDIVEFLNNLSLTQAMHRADELKVSLDDETTISSYAARISKDTALYAYIALNEESTDSPDAQDRLEDLDDIIMLFRSLYLRSDHNETVKLYRVIEDGHYFYLWRAA